MTAINVLKDFIAYKKIRKSINQSKLNDCINDYSDSNSIHKMLELDLKKAKYKYTIKLIEEDIVYLEHKLEDL